MEKREAMTVRAALYARVSREEMAAGYSIDTQLGSMRRYAQERGWDVIEYIEPGHTARTDDRPVFQELITDAETGRLDAVMVHRLDRGFRNLEDQLKDLRRLRELEVAFISVQEGFDDSSSHARFTQNIKGAVNQYYSDLLSEKTRDGKRARAKDGKSNASTTPYGYQRNAEGLDVPSPETRAAVVLAFESYATGEHSDTTVARLLNQAGYPPSGRAKSGCWTREGVRYLLTNRFYTGLVQHGDDWYPGQHEAIISKELFDEVRAIRAKRGRGKGAGRNPNRVYLLGRLARCHHCGLRLVSQTSGGKGRRGRPCQYLQCPARRRAVDCPDGGRYVPAAMIDAQVADLVKRLALPDDWRERLAKLAERREERENVEGKRQYLKGKLRRLRELYLDGDFDKAEYNRRKAELKAQLDALREPEAPEIEEAGETLETLADAWEGAPKHIQTEMLKTIFESVIVDVGGRRLVAVKPHAAFVPLFRLDGLEEKDGRFYPGSGEDIASES